MQDIDIQVSVITCLYNTPPDLFKNALESIYKQTFKDFEVLIINDGSTKYLEENKKIIESFNDERFKYFDTEHTGKSQTLNYGFKIAKGQYIAISDSDDQMYPERLEYQYLFLENSDYEVISNAMITDDNHIIFPTTQSSHDVDEHNIAWSTMHPCMMLDKNKVLSKVPFLFSQIYDSMEDAVFNFIMYHYGVKMWYDSNIMQIYSHKNENSVHFENVTLNLKKQYTYKLINKTFNYKDNKQKFTTVILLVNEKWKTDIEKTILNIRMTSNNVNILVIDYSKKDLSLSYLEKYTVSFIKLNDDQKSYSNALIEAINNCKTEYCMIISKPFRFFTQEWDLIFERYIEQFKYKHYIIQPYMAGFDKNDENNYVNENGKLEKEIRYGQQLNLFDKNISTKLDNIYLYSEYIFDANIPMIDDDLIFFTSVEYLKMIINGISIFNISKFISHYLSIASTLMWGNLKIHVDVKGVVLNENIIDNISAKTYNTIYYQNLFKLICFFCNESKYIYEKILYDSFDDKSIPSYIVNDHIVHLNEFNEIKNSINFAYDMSYFLKKNNTLKPWIQTFDAY